MCIDISLNQQYFFVRFEQLLANYLKSATDIDKEK